MSDERKKKSRKTLILRDLSSFISDLSRIEVENTRFELVTSCMPCKRSSQLS